MKTKISTLVALTLTVLSILTTLTVRPSVARTLPPNPRKELLNYVQLNLTTAFGPESLAFDPAGGGPYTGLSDGRVVKWDRHRRRWVDFAITTLHRRSKKCQGTDYLEQESLCGRPLGVQFCTATGDLYIADAYYGLLVVGPEGGLATQLATAADGQPFFLTNAVDVDQETGEVYFTDSSNQFHRKDWVWSIIIREATGRLLKYDPRTKQVTVLLTALAFGNGVALSKDNSYVLVTETTRSRILRYWLRGPKSGTSDVFLDVPQYPDNIKRTPKGEFWVAINSGKGKIERLNMTRVEEGVEEAKRGREIGETVAMRIDGEGRVVEVLGEGREVDSISEVVVGRGGELWLGSGVMPFVGVFRN